MQALQSALQMSTETSRPWASISATICIFSARVITCHMEGKRRYSWSGSSEFNYYPDCKKWLVFLHRTGNGTIVLGSMLNAWNKLVQTWAVTEQTANSPTWINNHWYINPFWYKEAKWNIPISSFFAALSCVATYLSYDWLQCNELPSFLTHAILLSDRIYLALNKDVWGKNTSNTSVIYYCRFALIMG